MHSDDITIVLAAVSRAAPADRVATLLQQLGRSPDALPLQAACEHGGWADTGNTEIALIDSQCDDARLSAVVAVYFGETVGGCNCNDDPVTHPAYARLRVVTQLVDGTTTIHLTEDG